MDAPPRASCRGGRGVARWNPIVALTHGDDKLVTQLTGTGWLVTGARPRVGRMATRSIPFRVGSAGDYASPAAAHWTWSRAGGPKARRIEPDAGSRGLARRSASGESWPASVRNRQARDLDSSPWRIAHGDEVRA